jgi:H+/Cl- antiporter ClcA
MTFFDWHQRQTEQWMERLHMSLYQALWFAWFKGAVLGAAVCWWLLVYPKRASGSGSIDAGNRR